MSVYESRIYFEGKVSKIKHIVYGRPSLSASVLLFMAMAFAGRSGDVFWIWENKNLKDALSTQKNKLGVK